MKQTLSLTLVYIAVFGALSQPVIASDDQAIEIIEVYAQKRAQSLDEVSIAVTPISGANISRSAVKDTTELGAFVTNMKISQNAAEGTPPAINIRGVGLLDYNTANTSPVAMYVDGASVGSANNQLVNFFDIEQVEILKGPQGTLFGRNSTGGAVLIRSKRPDAGTYGEVKVGIGSDDRQKVQGFYNASINNESALRFAVNHVKYDYTSYNLHPTAPEAHMEQSDLRLSYFAQWDELSVYLKANYSHWSGIVQPVGNIGVKNPNTGAVCTPNEAMTGRCVDNFGFNDGSDDFWAVNVNNDSPHHSIGKGWTAEVEYQLNDKAQLVWINAFSRLDREHAFNCDGSPVNTCEGNLGLKAELLNNEVRYQSEYANGYLTSGIFQLEERLYQDNYNDILRDLRGTVNGANSVTFFYDNIIRNKVLAIFAQYEWQWRTDTTVTFGLRYSDESVDYDSVARINAVVDPSDLNGAMLPFYDLDGDNDDSGWSGRFALNHQLDKNKLLYYSFANGTKSGGYNGGLLSSAEQAKQADYGTESLNAHEIGAKLTFSDSRVRLNSALFYYDYQDQQVFMNQPSETPGVVPLQLLENVGASKIYGAESDLYYDINKHIDVQVGLGYIPHAEFEEFVDPVGVSLTDNRLPFTSKFNVNAQVSFAQYIEFGTLTTTLGVDYQSEYYFDQLQNDYAKQDGYALWRFNSLLDMGQWQANIWAKNLFDKEYSNLKFDLRNFLGMLQDFKGEGRRVGLDIRYRF
ncbi:Vitamin B12 transporter BtuB [Pseudoalteromonas holothuriae]|uniref:Vitamin B12 transporter BtuB n=1 Tax=Pseudoalteromonas holothuriae TaxID=2963714 RepID=A0A9W4QYA2_9GAMM|nr:MULTISPECIES: TonB-dependent receptor [unclassified Pseudoalteromonas]CAH9058147.1 Vitamin B12 transporter BtuB [Pseudoalteromonas sp. CIP111951]CAH9058535.1 Vitamin B12 transporter BtuB [Pseudoalteromonas sp. CIP111854]